MDAVAAADELRCLLISHNTATRQLQSLDNEISRLTSKLETLPTACHLPLTQRMSALEGVRRMFSVFCSLKWQEVQAYVGEISSSLDEQHMDLEADVSFEEDVRDGHQVTWTSCVSHRGQVSLSHGQAKLSLRHQVLEEDAVMAIRIYEEILTARFGMSILNVQPRSHVTSKCFEEFIGPENDRAMHQFHVQLIRFCGHTGNMEE